MLFVNKDMIYIPYTVNGIKGFLGEDGRLYNETNPNILVKCINFVLRRLHAQKHNPINNELNEHDHMRQLLDYVSIFLQNMDFELLKSRVTRDPADMLSSDNQYIFGSVQYYDIFKTFMTLRILAYHFGKENILRILCLNVSGCDYNEDDAFERLNDYLSTEKVECEEEDRKVEYVDTLRDLWDMYFINTGTGMDLWTMLNIMQTIAFPNLKLKLSPPNVYGPEWNQAIQSKNNYYGVVLFLLWTIGVYEITDDLTDIST